MKKNAARDGSRLTAVYRQMLLEKKAEVLAGLGVKFDTLARLGRVAEEDQAQISHDEFISLSRNSMDYERLGLVDEALERLNRGDYGICEGCQEPIPAKRLTAVPWTRYCVRCQELMEPAAAAVSREEQEQFALNG